MKARHRGLLTILSIFFLFGGLFEIVRGMFGVFAAGVLLSIGRLGWGSVLVILSLFQGMLMLGAGITGLRQDARRGALILGSILLVVSVFAFLLSLFVPPFSFLPMTVLILSILYLFGISMAS